MVKLPKKFSVGERVFAKVRGYPPWPAKIESITDPTSKQAKYHVVFFGTKEIGTCKIEDLFRYAENKDKFSKTVRRKFFHEGIEELEEDLKKNPNPVHDDSGKVSDTEATENVPENAADDSTVTSNDSMNPPTGDEDTDAGNLVIDETDKKKAVKRKSQVVPPSTPDVTEVKKKRGRKSMATILAENTPKLDTTSHDSQDEDGDKKVSRSGRKIKPKRFHDSIDAEISIDSSRNDQSARSRTKSKTEDSNEDIVTPIKKRTGVEKEDKKNVLIDSVEAEQNQFKLKTLRLESHILFLDTQIRSSLGLDKANVDDCLDALDQLLEYEITPLMLKKHSHIVETIKRLRRYIGNLPDWKLSEEETIVFKQKAEQIKNKAEEIYSKFKVLFEIPEGQSFWNVFVKQLEEFKKATAHMSDEEKYSLLVDPTAGTTTTTESKPAKVEAVTSPKKNEAPAADSTSSKDVSVTEAEAK